MTAADVGSTGAGSASRAGCTSIPLLRVVGAPAPWPFFVIGAWLLVSSLLQITKVHAVELADGEIRWWDRRAPWLTRRAVRTAAVDAVQVYVPAWWVRHRFAHPWRVRVRNEGRWLPVGSPMAEHYAERLGERLAVSRG